MNNKKSNFFYLDKKFNIEYGSFGKQGETGPRGKEGPIGNRGPPGIKLEWDGLKIGDKGYTGKFELGPPGQFGDSGSRGDKGNRGPVGIIGDKGDFGCGPGTIGIQGMTGDKGPDGEKGEKGEKGNLGSQGTKGLKGRPGTGIPGPPGDIGDSSAPKGFKGTQGLRGPSGDDGGKGLKGFIGEKGDKGVRGKRGYGFVNLMAAAEKETKFRITYLGVWEDRSERAIKPNCLLNYVKVYNPNSQMVNVGSNHKVWIEKFIKLMEEGYEKSGIFTIQYGDEMFFHIGNTDDYKKYSEIGQTSTGAKSINNLNITFKNNLGDTVNVAGGAWQNAVYKVELIESNLEMPSGLDLDEWTILDTMTDYQYYPSLYIPFEGCFSCHLIPTGQCLNNCSCQGSRNCCANRNKDIYPSFCLSRGEVATKIAITVVSTSYGKKGPNIIKVKNRPINYNKSNNDIFPEHTIQFEEGKEPELLDNPNDAYIYNSGVKGNGRGIQIVRLKYNNTNKNWEYHSDNSYDNWKNPSLTTNLKNYLNTFEKNDIVILNTNDEPSRGWNTFYPTLKEKFGASGAESGIAYRSCYIFIGMYEVGKIYENYNSSGRLGATALVKKREKTYSIPGYLYDSGWFRLKSQNGVSSFVQKNHNLKDFADRENPIDRLPYLCRVYVRVPYGNGYTNEGFIYEAGGLSSSDDDHNEYSGLLFAYNEKNIRIWVPDQYNNSKYGYILMTGDGWGNGSWEDLYLKEADVRIVAW